MSEKRFRSRKQQAKHTKNKPKKGEKFFDMRKQDDEFTIKENRRG